MNEEKYKLNILKDILKFSKKKLTKEEMNMLLLSALFQNKNYFTSAALLVKRGSITMEEMISLGTLKKEELSAFLDPVDDDYNYFAKITPEEILAAFKDMEEFIKNNPEQALENRHLNKEQKEKIKEYHHKITNDLSRRA